MQLQIYFHHFIYVFKRRIIDDIVSGGETVQNSQKVDDVMCVKACIVEVFAHIKYKLFIYDLCH